MRFLSRRKGLTSESQTGASAEEVLEDLLTNTLPQCSHGCMLHPFADVFGYISRKTRWNGTQYGTAFLSVSVYGAIICEHLSHHKHLHSRPAHTICRPVPPFRKRSRKPISREKANPLFPEAREFLIYTHQKVVFIQA